MVTACTSPRDGRLLAPDRFGVAESLFLLGSYELGGYMRDCDALVARNRLQGGLRHSKHPIHVRIYTSGNVC